MIPFNIATHTRNIVVPLCATMCLPDITTNFDVKQASKPLAKATLFDPQKRYDRSKLDLKCTKKVSFGI